MITVDVSDIQKFERDLQTFKASAYPFATRATLNTAAFSAQRQARENLTREFILRNKFTVQSVQVQKATSLKVEQQRAVVGAAPLYLEDQEFSGTKQKRGAEGLPIATAYSAGQSREAKPRTRLPRAGNKLQAIRLKHRAIRAKSQQQKNIIAVKQAVASGSKFVFLDLQKRKGIFKVTGGKRNPQIQMVHDLTRSVIPVKRHPWLAPAVAVTEKRMPELYFDALKFQIDKHKIFK